MLLSGALENMLLYIIQYHILVLFICGANHSFVVVDYG